MKRWQKILLWLLVIGLLGFGIMKGYVYYLNNKPHRDVTNEQGIGVTAEQMMTEFNANETVANQKYANKAIEVSGEVLKSFKNQDSVSVIHLKTSDPIGVVNCVFKKDIGPIAEGSNVTFKGVFTAFLVEEGIVKDIMINEGVLVKQ